MAGRISNGLKSFVMWDYARSSWQYELVVTLILAFIFLTPRGIFGDQPRPKKVTLLSSTQQISSFLIDPELFAQVPENERSALAEKLIHSQAGNRNRVVQRIEPVVDKDDGEVRGYIVYTRP